jgi:phosphate transport system substrate-binding protein
MINLAQMWAEEYAKKKPSVKVEVSGGGSGVGIRDLMQGVVQIANASRELEPAERDQILKKTGKAAVETIAGYDGIAIYTHKDNPVESITQEQLARIFGEGGDINNWSQLGVNMSAAGAQDKIVRVSRQNSSGTYMYFREHILKKHDFKPGSCDMSGSKDVVELVARTKTAIGYSGMGYATKNVKMLKVSLTTNAPAVAPSVETVITKAYPLSRALLLFTPGAPEGETGRYIEWILSVEGQKIVEEAGYVPAIAGK